MVPRASESLRSTTHHWAGMASSQDAKYAHIAAEDKQKVQQTLTDLMLTCCNVMLHSADYLYLPCGVVW